MSICVRRKKRFARSGPLWLLLPYEVVAEGGRSATKAEVLLKRIIDTSVDTLYSTGLYIVMYTLVP
jgi:hypothetical protein